MSQTRCVLCGITTPSPFVFSMVAYRWKFVPSGARCMRAQPPTSEECLRPSREAIRRSVEARKRQRSRIGGGDLRTHTAARRNTTVIQHSAKSCMSMLCHVQRVVCAAESFKMASARQGEMSLSGGTNKTIERRQASGRRGNSTVTMRSACYTVGGERIP